MKPYFLIAILTVFVAFGCKEKEKKEIERLNKENLELRMQSQVKDSSINDILQSFHQIESNLAQIKEREALITVKSSDKSEMTPDVKARINEDIKVINDLMAKNRTEIARLRKLLKASNLKMEEVERMVTELNAQIEDRNTQIAALKDDLSKTQLNVETLNASIDTLETERTQLTSTVQERTEMLNTAYYVVGSKKELLGENVIAKEGGVAGINTAVKLKADFNDDKFERIDIRELSEIPINSKKPTLVTTHPAGTYELEKNDNGVVERIRILNPEKFWSTSKYLVVMR